MGLPITAWLRSSIVVAAFATGCGDPGFTMRGTVSDRDHHPVADTEVVLVCYGNDHIRARTDASGHFQTTHVGVFGSECVVRVAQSTFSVVDHCSRWHNRKKCAEVTLDVTLP